MGTNFYWNTEQPEVLETIETLGNWRAPLRRRYSEPLSPETIAELRTLGVPDGVLENMANPTPPSLQDYSHIGKRSAAGLYCYSCNSWFHDPANCDKREPDERRTCKYCGKGPEDVMSRAASMELGFSEAEADRPESGVKGTCSFGWANWPDEVYRIALTAPVDMPLVIDEYGRTMTGQEFLTMMRSNVDITKMSIGQVFS